MIAQLLFPVVKCNPYRSLPPTLSLVQTIYPRNEINEGEKMLWIWLTSHSTESEDASCLFSYQQLSDIMQWKVDSIHRALLRLRLLGFLKCDLPLLHGVVSPVDAIVVHKLYPTLPELEKARERQVTINLLKNHRGKQRV